MQRPPAQADPLFLEVTVGYHAVDVARLAPDAADLPPRVGPIGSSLEHHRAILIGICSCHRMGDRRQAVRDTWLTTLPAGLSAVFFVGEGGTFNEPNLVSLPVRDDYDALSIKVQSFYRYALTYYAFDYLFKCDDDTYVHGERLAALPQPGFDLIGSMQLESHGFASGGAGYLMSRALVEKLIARPLVPRCDEDVLISDRARETGARWTATDTLDPFGTRWPESGNNIVTTHWCDRQAMRRIHAAVGPDAHGAVMLELRATHQAWSGTVHLYPDGWFWSRGPASPNGTWRTAEDGNVLWLHWYHWPSDALHLQPSGFDAPALRLEFVNAGGHDAWQRIARQDPEKPS